MARHILDRQRPLSANRLARYIDRDRAEDPHPASRALHQRQRATPEGSRLPIYTRIERRKEG